MKLFLTFNLFAEYPKQEHVLHHLVGHTLVEVENTNEADVDDIIAQVQELTYPSELNLRTEVEKYKILDNNSFRVLEELMPVVKFEAGEIKVEDLDVEKIAFNFPGKKTPNFLSPEEAEKFEFIGNHRHPRLINVGNVVTLDGESPQEAVARIHQYLYLCIIGKPQQDGEKTVEELENEGIIGLYKRKINHSEPPQEIPRI